MLVGCWCWWGAGGVLVVLVHAAAGSIIVEISPAWCGILDDGCKPLPAEPRSVLLQTLRRPLVHCRECCSS